MSKSAWVYNILLICFFLSGAAGLIYEVVWTRMLTLVFGTTVYATSTVLTVFMAGLAFGSFYFGRYIDRHPNPLRVYGLLEGAIGIYCLFIPLMVANLPPLYISVYHQASHYLFSLFLFLLCSFILFIPTTLMGATLPVLSKFFVRNLEFLGWNVGKLYSINTFGAVVGCFGTGFSLIPAIGVKTTVYTAVAINILIFFVILTLDKIFREPRIVPENPEEVEAVKEASVSQSELPSAVVPEAKVLYPKRVFSLVLISFALAGFASLVYEVAWTRALSLVFGSSVYAFTTMLTAILCGIALGSFLMALFIDRLKEPLHFFGLVELLLGASVISLTPVFGKLPFIFVQLYENYHSRFFLFQGMQFLTCFGLMLVPTTLMGAAFPVVSKIYTERLKHLGSRVGNVYAVNTLGCIFGSFLGGFALIPLLGTQNTIYAAAAFNILIGYLILSFSIFLYYRKVYLVPLTALLLVIFCLWAFLPKWDQEIMNRGVYYHTNRFQGLLNKKWVEEMKSKSRLIFYQEGVTANVAVFEWRWQEGGKLRQERILHINGKVEASSTSDLLTQVMCAHLPLILHENPKKVFLIGLGSGCTLGAIEQHPVKEIDCVEIEPLVIEAAKYFAEANHNALEDRRANVIVGDGRNFALLSRDKYDVIISEPSNPFITGVSNLFTQDHYLLCKKRLNKRGLMCQWVHYYSMSLRDFKIALKTFISVFPHVSLWDLGNGDVLLIGSLEPIKLDFERLNLRLEEPGIKSDLEKSQRAGWRTFQRIEETFVTEGQGLIEFVQNVPINTDNLPLIEFSAPRYLYASDEMTMGRIAEELMRLKEARSAN